MASNQVFIIEDNIEFASKLKTMMQTYFDKKEALGTVLPYEKINVVTDGFDSWLEELKSLEVPDKNLYVLDVTLDGSLTGFQIAQKIRKFDVDGDILFVTSHVELMGQVFVHNLKALSYIHKYDPLMKERLVSALDQLFYEFKLKKNSQFCESGETEKGLTKKDRDKNAFLTYQYKNIYYRIEFEDIYSIETDTFRRRLNIHTNQQTHPCQKKLITLIAELPESFIQIHRSILVNLNKVTKVMSDNGNYMVVLSNTESYPISRSYVSNVLEKFKE